MEKTLQHESLKLTRFDLRDPREWAVFCRLFTAYLKEVCSAEEYRENLQELHDPTLSQGLVRQTLQTRDPYFVMRIESETSCTGFVSYSYYETRRTGFLNNFFVLPSFRGLGIGASAYRMVECHLRGLGAQQLELIPVERAQGFYLRLGFAPFRINGDGEQVYAKLLTPAEPAGTNRK